MELNKLLKRQIKRSSDNEELNLEELYSQVSETYDGHDESLRLMEQTNKTLEAEVMELNGKMQIEMNNAIASKNQVKEILDSISQGIATFDKDLVIDEEYSKFMNVFYKRVNLSGLNVFTTLFPLHNLGDNRFNMMLEATKAILGENDISWELNSHNLPNEMTIKIDSETKFIKIEWAPIIDIASSIIKKIMLSIKDVTLERVLEKQIEAEKNKNKRITDCVSELLNCDQQAVKDFLHSSKPQLELVQKELDLKNLEQMFITLHTIKGSARLFKLEKLANHIHKAESEITNLKKDSSRSLQILESEVFNSLEHMETIDYVLSHIFKIENKRAVSDNLFSLYGNFLQIIWDKVIANNFTFGGLTCEDSILHWQEEAFAKIHHIIIHCLNNSIDHGFIRPMQEGRCNESRVKLNLRAYFEEDKVKLSISDNGSGVNFAKVLQKLGRPATDTLSEKELTDVLFAPNFSTSDNASISSGRGMGLAAVRQYVDSLQGEIAISSNQKGTSIVITMPFTSCVKLDPI